MSVENLPRTIWWEDDTVRLIDQTRLPLQGDVLVCNTYQGLITAIKSLAVRGAPALGVAGAYAMALWSQVEGRFIEDVEEYKTRFSQVAEEIAHARPTAINLSWGVGQIADLIKDDRRMSAEELHESIVARANEMAEQDEAANRALGAFGAELFGEGTKFLTHCNTGSLATVFFGTALGVIFTAFEQGKVEHVWVDETRPLNQGGRLTAWELLQVGIPSALITDSMAADVMAKGWVDAVILGADRICSNGDVVNKIGTYGLSVLAKEHDIPFYVAAPTTSVDTSLACGADVEIEERDPREIEGVTVTGKLDPSDSTVAHALDALTAQGSCELPMSKGHHMTIDRKGGGYSFDAWFRTTPPQVMSFNPAFDMTPAKNVTAYITELGVIHNETGDPSKAIRDLIEGKE
ncbi:MAG: S-methyl-5-thioribose-1-phosphate isomerase [Actinomycetia bacterium]|nr:S-methyl-5-thioribose-1-phosphate isomerase [Actinomycetes bacterium]